MKATLEVELEPFFVPNFVRSVPKDGVRECVRGAPEETPCYPLSDLDVETLDKLCRKFREHVFMKADKEPPEFKGLDQ